MLGSRSAAHDVSYNPTFYSKGIANKGTVTTPWHGLCAHNSGWIYASNFTRTSRPSANSSVAI
jgi:hypothetical protein